MKGWNVECQHRKGAVYAPLSEIITDAQCEEFTALSRLVASADERRRTGQFYVEGMRFVSRATDHSADILAVVGSPSLMTHPFARELWNAARERGQHSISLSPALFRGLSQVSEPQGIGAVVRQRWSTLDSISTAGGLCWIMVDEIQSPGNLGTIFRSCDAVGAAGIIFVGSVIDPHAANVVRATMGAIFGQRCIRTTLPEFRAWKRRNDCLWVATSPSARLDYRSVRYKSPTILWMGGEKRGLSAETQSLCDRSVRIPIVGSSDSLNLAMATSVILYEVFNQRHHVGVR